MGMCVLIASLLLSPKSNVECQKSKVECQKPMSKVECQMSKDFRLSTFDFRLIRLMMNVHRLDTDASWSSHARQVHTRAAEEAGS
jgi:hypothetical protein